jgi:glucose/arabinose dehydrogenase
LNAPHGIAFHNGKLYLAGVDGVYRYDWDEANLRATNPQRIVDLSGTGGGHMTKTLIFWDGKMYVSSGSTCNVCKEKDPRRAVVMQFNEDGSGMKVFAHGLRNAVGMTISPATKTIWVSDNGRDWLGDDLPPDEIYDLGQNGGDFGWPWCYGDRVPDLKFSKDSPQHCSDVVLPKVNLQAHSAPLGLAFYDSDKFPAEYRGDLFVAFHGSWNRSVPTGFKVVRIHFAEGQKPQVEDFVTGWMKPNASRASRPLGRPVGVAVGPDGALYISDDTNGAIYRVTYSR